MPKYRTVNTEPDGPGPDQIPTALHYADPRNCESIGGLLGELYQRIGEGCQTSNLNAFAASEVGILDLDWDLVWACAVLLGIAHPVLDIPCLQKRSNQGIEFPTSRCRTSKILNPGRC